MKKRLSEDQEFQIMKLVLDKFLWLGFGIMLFGMYKLIMGTVNEGITFLIAGAVLLVLFLVIIVKEYEIIV